MYECDATCEEILGWFHSDVCPEDILLLWMAPRLEDSGLLSEIIDNVHLIDSVLQDKIAFLIVQPTGKTQAARIGPATPLFRLLRESLSVPALQEAPGRRRYVRRAVNRTQSKVGSFARDLGVKAADLPAIAVVTKFYGDVLISPFSGRTDFPALESWLLALEEMIARYRENQSAIPSLPPLIADRMNELGNVHAQCEAKRAAIIEVLDRFYRRYPECQALARTLPQIVSHPARFTVTNFKPAWTELEVALQAPEHKRAADHLPRATVTKNLGKLEELEQFVLMLSKEAPSLAERRRQTEAAYEQLTREIRSLASMGIGAKWVVPTPIKYKSILPTITRQLQQLVRLWGLIEHLIKTLPHS